MKKLELNMLWGVLLIVLGGLLLLQTLGVLGAGAGLLWALLWALLFGAGGVVFLYVFFTKRANWWAIIPGLALLGIAVLILGDEVAPRGLGELGGSLFLGAIAVSFWIVYLLDRERWWAVIPAGVLSTLTVIAGLPDSWQGTVTGGLFFIGLALTFGLVYLLPTKEGQMKWALIPAGILFLMGLVLMATSASLINVIWPLGLIVVGGYIILRNFIPRKGE